MAHFTEADGPAEETGGKCLGLIIALGRNRFRPSPCSAWPIVHPGQCRIFPGEASGVPSYLTKFGLGMIALVKWTSANVETNFTRSFVGKRRLPR